MVIAGGIGQRALALFAEQGIAVRAGQSGATVEELASAWLNGQLVNEPEGCAHHHDDAGGDHHHQDGCHGNDE